MTGELMGNSIKLGKPLSYSIEDLWAGKVSDRVLKKMKSAQQTIEQERKDEQLEARRASLEE